ncbi:MAG: hypothetical protein ABFD15_06610 [Methanofastidiosum sp.]
MKIFRVIIEKSQSTETLVMADDCTEANILVIKAAKLGEIEFDYEQSYDVESCREIEASTAIINEIKEYGIVNEKADVIYDGKIVQQLIEANKKRLKEEFLKKHHMEFDFAKEIKNGNKTN